MPASYSNPRFIHRGGFGIVEEVTDERGQTWARKTFDAPSVKADPARLEKARRRFQRETTVQANLNHPHIMPIVDSDMNENPPWYIMPLAEEDFTEQITRDRIAGTVSLDPLLHILAGLEEMHRLGYVHRDLKPGNVLRIGEKWIVSDFGLVLPQARDTTILSTKTAWGSEGYAAPEQATDFADTPPQADIYAFGCILHDLVSTNPRIPFSQAHAPGHVLSPIIERCTEQHPDDRFQDVASLRNALVGVLTAPTHRPVRADVQPWLTALEDHPDGIDESTWINIVRFLDREPESEDADTLLRAIDLPQLDALHANAPRVFLRIAVRIARWARDGSFDFAYCDVLGARLIRIYELGGVRERSEATMGAFQLGYSHNRWAVMRQFLRMASHTIDDDLADRLTVEMYALGWDAFWRFNRIADQIHAGYGSIHPKIADALQRIEEQWKAQRVQQTDPFVSDVDLD
jgi:serine/threonine protein kinase